MQTKPTPEAWKAATAIVKLYRTPGEGGIRQNLEDRIAVALDSFAASAVERERERCVKICEALAKTEAGQIHDRLGSVSRAGLAAARIRTGEQP